jgi:hypothetical protein
VFAIAVLAALLGVSAGYGMQVDTESGHSLAQPPPMNLSSEY